MKLGGFTLLGPAHFGLLQRPGQGPESPFGDALGWIIVFFVIVWPILRGILETAKTQRKEFEAKQAKQAKGAPPGANRRRTLEEILEGRLERADVDPRDSRGGPSGSPADAEPPRRVQRQKIKKAPLPEARFGERPMGENSAPIYGADDLYSSDRNSSNRSGELVGDPFDEAAMERDLVPEAKLRHIPSEDEVESGSSSSGTQARGVTRSSVAGGPRAAAPAIVESGLAREDPEAIFRRLPRPLSPWQKAIVLREVLGEPLASRPSPALPTQLDRS